MMDDFDPFHSDAVREMERHLIEEYPNALRKTDERWPYDLFGIECHPGWRKALEVCLPVIEKAGLRVHQIKEKFGGLRVYLDGYTKETDEAIAEAANVASVTCEFCGEPGRPRSGGWIKTLCDNCNSAWKRPRK